MPQTLYLNENNELLPNPSEDVIEKHAQVRLTANGYSLRNEPVKGTASSYEFEIEQDTTITFDWAVDYALNIENDLTGVVDDRLDSSDALAFGNPDPAVKKWWIAADELVTAQVDGVVNDFAGNQGAVRHLVSGYWASGAADSGKNRGTGSIRGANPASYNFDIAPGTPSGKALAILRGNAVFNDRLLFTATEANSQSNAYSIRYQSGATAGVAFANDTLTITVVDGTSTANDIIGLVNADTATHKFSAANLTGSNGADALKLHGTTLTQQAGGGLDAVGANAIVGDDALSFTTTFNTDVISITWEAVASNPQAEFVVPTDGSGSLHIEFLAGTTNANDIHGLVQAATNTVSVSASRPFTLNTAPPPGGIIDGDLRLSVQQDYALQVAASTGGPGGNGQTFKYLTIAAPGITASYAGTHLSFSDYLSGLTRADSALSAISITDVTVALAAGTTNDTVLTGNITVHTGSGQAKLIAFGGVNRLTLTPQNAADLSGLTATTTSPQPSVTDTGRAVTVSIIPVYHTPLHVKAALDNHAQASVEATLIGSGTNTFPSNISTSVVTLTGGLPGVSAQAEMIINHAAHSAVTIEANSPGASLTDSQDTPLNAVRIALGNGVQALTYTGGDSMTIATPLATTTAADLASFLNLQPTFSQNWRATASGDGSGLLTSGSATTDGGVLGEAVTRRVSQSRENYLSFTPTNSDGLSLRFVSTGSDSYDENARQVTFVLDDTSTLETLQATALTLKDSATQTLAFSDVELEGDKDAKLLDSGGSGTTLPDGSTSATSVTVSGGTVSHRAVGRFDPSGENNELTFVATTPGTSTNGVKVYFVEDSSLSVTWVNASPDYLVIRHPETVLDLSSQQRRPTTANDIANAVLAAVQPDWTITVSPANLHPFPEFEQRQQVPQFVMDRPATVRYDWRTQYRISAGTTSTESESAPLLMRLDNGTTTYDTASGSSWFDAGATVFVGAKEHADAHSLRGWTFGQGQIPFDGLKDELVSHPTGSAPFTSYRGLIIDGLAEAGTIQFDFGHRIFDQYVTIGNALDFTALTSAHALPPSEANHLAAAPNALEEPIAVTGVTVTDGVNGAPIQEWDGVAHKGYPLRPGVYQAEWGTNRGDLRVITRITGGFPNTAVLTSLSTRLSPDRKTYDIRQQAIDGYGNLSNSVILSIANTTADELLPEAVRSLGFHFEDANSATPSYSEAGGRATIGLRFGQTTVGQLRTLLEANLANTAIVNPNAAASDAVGTRFGTSPAAWTHIAGTPGVELEPATLDAFHFLQLAYTSSDAALNGTAFANAQPGYSVLTFTTRTGVATGDREEETVHVRTVRSKDWHEGLDEADATVRQKISSGFDSAGLNTGNVFELGGQPRFNANIHDRAGVAGPIFPVNTHYNRATGDEVEQPNSGISVYRDDIVVCWYQNHNDEPQINWPYQAVKYNVSWPDTRQIAANTNSYDRIVIASMLGSEGKKWAENPATPADADDQQVFDSELFDQFVIYNQPDSAEPGYNPNEEHALLAVSFQSRAEANPPLAAFALRNDLNRTTQDATFTSEPFVLVQYHHIRDDEQRMWVYKVETEDTRTAPYSYTLGDITYDYSFRLPIRAGEPVTAPYPLDQVIGITPCPATYGVDQNPQKVYFEDHKQFAWCISGSSDPLNDDATFDTHWFYPLQPEFWNDRDYDGDGKAEVVGECVPLLPAGSGSSTLSSPATAGAFVTIVVTDASAFSTGQYISILDGDNTEHGLKITGKNGNHLTLDVLLKDKRATATVTRVHNPTPVRYVAEWPEKVATLKVGETLTFPGGEFRSDHPVSHDTNGNAFATPGLPGVVAWAAGELIFDSENAQMLHDSMQSQYTARLIRALSSRTVTLETSDYPTSLEPASGALIIDQGKYHYKELSASTQKRLFYDPLTQELGWKGFVNDKSIEDDSLTQSPPAVFVLEPNVMTDKERDEIKALSSDVKWTGAIDSLYALTRNPNGVDTGWTAGLQRNQTTNRIEQEQALGIGLALVTNSNLLSPTASAGSRYVSLAENNHPDLGDAPITIHIVRVVVGDSDSANNPNDLSADHFRYRGALKSIQPLNVFDEKVILRHTADYGGNPPPVVFEWHYRGEDGSTRPPPDTAGPGIWQVFGTPENGLGQYQIAIAGAGALLLRDNLFYMRYRHSNEEFILPSPPHSDTATADAPFQWVGAGNSRPPEAGQDPEDSYLPQLVPGWVKRVLDAVNPYEARIREFTSVDSPSTVVSMIQQLGPAYEGPVALNASKNVIENLGLIELYSTVLNRAKSLSIDLTTPIVDSGVNSAILLASTRISDFYTLLGNEAYQDALDPTIGYGSESSEYGHLAPVTFTFENQLDTMRREEIALLQGTDEFHARPVYNRLFWNFTKAEGEAAYVQAYHIQDHNRDGFIDESDAMIQYPQGHGDAWGHYLTAIKAQYELLHHPYFKWESRSELYNLQDIVIDVDYRDERKFADIAAAKARCGAKLVNSVYREAYTEDPEGQWQGYIDTDEDRAWGVEGWAKRAGQGALFDWLTGNALLPDEHPDHEFDNIQKVDRHTVTELDSIATQLARIETAMDAANSGLNPLGVSPDAVPFDIDSFFLTQDEHLGRSQFTQVYERALTALQNAKATFDYANKLDNMIRRASNEYTDFSWNIEQQDRDFRNRLIAYFGTPYAGTIGAGKLFPEGYYGPDLITYQYVDVREINNDTTPGLHSTYELFLRKLRTGFDGGTTNSPVSIAIKKSELGWHGLDDAKASAYKEKFAFLFDRDFPSPNLDLIIPTSTDYFDRNLVQLHLPRQAKGYSFQALGNWGQRAATGSIQEAIREMLLVEADLFNAIAEYDGMVGWFTRDYNDLIQLAELARESEERLNDKIEKMKGFRAGMIVADHVSMGSEIAGDLIKDLADAIGDSVPDDQTAGTSNSIPTFLGMPIKIAGVVGKAPFSILSLLAADASAALELEQDVLFEEIEKQQQNAEFEFDVIQETHDLLNNLGDEPMARISVFAAQERHRRAADALRTQILEANNLLQEREVFNRKTASVTQRQRYQDMTFRVYRNDALRKYQQAFDLAARYAYLAAKAYDYETNLDPDHPASARGLYSDIVSTTSLGATTMQGQPIVGPRGLADILGRMNANYEHLANQFGFRNFATETHTFSLRRELMRIQSDSSKDKNFRQALAEARVDDLWQVPEFRRHCRPIASPEDGPQPGIVLPIPTHIATGKNFFGKTLAGGDSAYDPSNYSTRIYGLNTTFDNYDSVRMAATPRVYLVPTGHDLMYIPDATSLRTRAWKIEDQAIPAPYNIGTHELELPDWLPIADSLSSRIAEIRRHPTFLAGTDPDAVPLNTRLIGRSVWNTRWVLIIPGVSLLGDGKDGIDTLIYGGLKSGKTVTADDYDPVGDRDGNGVKDIRLTIQSYSYSGI